MESILLHRRQWTFWMVSPQRDGKMTLQSIIQFSKILPSSLFLSPATNISRLFHKPQKTVPLNSITVDFPSPQKPTNKKNSIKSSASKHKNSTSIKYSVHLKEIKNYTHDFIVVSKAAPEKALFHLRTESHERRTFWRCTIESSSKTTEYKDSSTEIEINSREKLKADQSRSAPSLSRRSGHVPSKSFGSIAELMDVGAGEKMIKSQLLPKKPMQLNQIRGNAVFRKYSSSTCSAEDQKSNLSFHGLGSGVGHETPESK